MQATAYHSSSPSFRKLAGIPLPSDEQSKNSSFDCHPNLRLRMTLVSGESWRDGILCNA